MMNVKTLIIFSFSITLSNLSFANDLDQVVAGGEVEDSLGKMSATKATSPYFYQASDTGEINNLKPKSSAQSDYIFDPNPAEVSVKDDPRKKYKDFSYTAPGTLKIDENYIELDKKAMAYDFRRQSSGGINISFIKNGYQYVSDKDVINQTIGSGYKHVKGGALFIRSDQFFFRSNFLNTFWSLGGGVGYNSGRGLFVTGERSNTTFRLWEIPIDLGLGLEIPIYHWFKIAGVAGPSVSALYQNRDDFQSGEKGKNKTQVSTGKFANAQFKINLSGFSDEVAYDLFTSSKITNLFLNLEARYQEYQKFQDNIKISGTSFGVGFTFEYL